MTISKNVKKTAPKVKAGETLRLHITKNGKAVYVPMELSISRA